MDSNEHKLKDVLKEMLNAYKLRSGLNETRIKLLWKNMMGNTIDGYTKGIKVYRRKLYINIESASLRQELSFGKEKIRKNLNEALGEEYIKEVIIR